MYEQKKTYRLTTPINKNFIPLQWKTRTKKPRSMWWGERNRCSLAQVVWTESNPRWADLEGKEEELREKDVVNLRGGVKRSHS